jgi:hypothetical protein
MSMTFAAVADAPPRKRYQACFTRKALRSHDDLSASETAAKLARAGYPLVAAAVNNWWWEAIPGQAPIADQLGIGGLPLAARIAQGILSLSCESDHDQELVTYITANDQTKLYAENNDNCFTVPLATTDTLNLSAHGFECDMSCGEHWDDLFTLAPDDRVGWIRAAFRWLPDNFGAPITPGVTGVYTLKSQPDLGTPLARSQSFADYQMTIRIKQVDP